MEFQLAWVAYPANSIAAHCMGEKFTTTRRVEFCETDAAGIAHFSAFVLYMEQAEHAFLRSLDESVSRATQDGWHVSWPRVHVEIDFRGSARFEDELKIQVGVKRIGRKSVTYTFEFECFDEVICTGSMVAVCCRVKSGHALESTEVPAELADKLTRYLP